MKFTKHHAQRDECDGRPERRAGRLPADGELAAHDQLDESGHAESPDGRRDLEETILPGCAGSIEQGRRKITGRIKATSGRQAGSSLATFGM
jgi:hypothetical protein